MRIAALYCTLAALAAAQKPPLEWTVYGGDQGAAKYSPLDDVHKANVAQLRPAWEWRTGETPLPEFQTTPATFQATPLMIDGTLYLSTPYNRVVALDAATGQEKWAYDPKAYAHGQVPNGTGFVHRGVAAWRDGGKLRLFLNTRWNLVCIDAASGRPVDSFGDNGRIDLSQNLSWEINPKHYTNTSPPVVYRNLVIVGNGVADRLVYKNDPPGDVRAFDARTGKLVWTFRPVPRPGEFGNETWGNDSWKFTGHTNVWAPMSLDEARGLVYLPLSTPSNDFYGARRPGANLFAESIVCLDAATGKRKWHFQVTHHGLWDYDLPAAPILATIRANGRRIDVVVQLTKQGWAFVFDRVTGKPVWPIEERPVAKGDVPGEQYWPTQPAPTRPPAFSEQGVSVDDAFDLTPELKAEAIAEMQKYRFGPLYTPPSREGTIMRPGIIGGANWGGGAVDPATGVLYVKSSNNAAIARLAKPDAAGVDADFVRMGRTNADFAGGIPLVKPPYGHLTAIDLNKGEILWRVPFGDNAELRKHPRLARIKLPERLGAVGVPGVLATKGGVLFAGGGDTSLYAFDTATGAELWSHPLGRRSTGTPMTYRTAAGKQYIVIATGTGADAVLRAFTLP